MTFRDWDELLKFVEVLTKWPPTVLAVAWLLRDKLKSFQLEGKDLKVGVELKQEIKKLRQFVAEADPHLVKQAAPKLIDEILASLPEGGRSRFEDKPDEEEQDGTGDEEVEGTVDEDEQNERDDADKGGA